MSNLHITTEINITATLTLTEGQLRALDALAGYGDESFFKAFYIKLGKSYMQPFEKDMRELFALIRTDVPPALTMIKESRKSLGIRTANGKWIKRQDDKL